MRVSNPAAFRRELEAYYRRMGQLVNTHLSSEEQVAEQVNTEAEHRERQQQMAAERTAAKPEKGSKDDDIDKARAELPDHAKQAERPARPARRSGDRAD